MKLRDLKARFLRRVGPGSWRLCAMAEADGVIFLCPKCFTANGGPMGTHSVICWFVGRVPATEQPGPGRWIPSGLGVDDLTFIGPGAASVQLTKGCQWHGFVRKGAAS